MRVPASLEPLLDMGIIDDVIRPLMAGKEAQVYLVSAYGDVRVAKVYKDAGVRSFKNRADYTEGRRGRNTRRERAKGRGSRYGKAEVEQAWRSAEVDAMFALREAGVRVPEAYDFVEGVLVMELIRDAEGYPAPRLVDLDLSPGEATDLYNQLLREVCKMLCSGLVHGDLSDFNVLLAHDGPVIIDFPQAIDATANRNARRILIRDVDNLTSFLARWDPDLRGRPYGQEMWELYERGALEPDTQLTGRVRRKSRANVRAVLDEISHANSEEDRKREAEGRKPRRGAPDSRPPPQRARATSPPKKRQDENRRGKKKNKLDPFDDLDALLTLGERST